MAGMFFLIASLISTMLEVVLRSYAGKMTQSVQDDLVRSGYSENGVRALPKLLEQVPQKDKDALRFWAVDGDY